MSAADGEAKVREHVIDGIFVRDSGPIDGRPLVFGHSLLFDGRMWEAQVADLEKDHRCINLDFRGHGQSTPPPRGFSMLAQADDYRKVMDALGVERATVVGLSMGGMASMHFAVAHPARVVALALFDTSAEVEPPKARAKETAMALTARVFGINDFLLKQVAPIMWSARFRAERADVTKVWDERMQALNKTAAYRAVRMVLTRPAVGPRLGDVRVPTLVVVGDEDVATRPSKAKKIAETIAGAELRILPRTGHISAVEEPEIVTKLLRSFLARTA